MLQLSKYRDSPTLLLPPHSFLNCSLKMFNFYFLSIIPYCWNYSRLICTCDCSLYFVRHILERVWTIYLIWEKHSVYIVHSKKNWKCNAFLCQLMVYNCVETLESWVILSQNILWYDTTSNSSALKKDNNPSEIHLRRNYAEYHGIPGMPVPHYWHQPAQEHEGCLPRDHCHDTPGPTCLQTQAKKSLTAEETRLRELQQYHLTKNVSYRSSE